MSEGVSNEDGSGPGHGAGPGRDPEPGGETGEAASEPVGATVTLGDLGAQFVLAGLYFATILGGLALADEMAARNIVMFQNEGDVGNVGVFAALVLGWTAVMILAFRYDLGTELLRAVLSLVFGLMCGTVFAVVTGLGTVAGGTALTAGFPTSPVPVVVGLVAAVVLWSYPEWYVLNVAGVILGAAMIPILGLGFGPLPIVVLLVVWAGYDAYAVYVSGHMQELVDGMGDLKLPFVFVVPHALPYSMAADGLELTLTEDDESEAATAADVENAAADAGNVADESDDESGLAVALLGLGDAVIPGMLAVSAGAYLDAPAVVPALNANLPALGAVAGGVLGMAALTYVLHRVEGAHAGLPPLNAGVLVGYLAGAVAAGIPVTTAVGF